MKHWQGIAEVPVGTGPKVVTIGKFDGIHLGHQALLKAARKAADERGIEAVAVTFDHRVVDGARAAEFGLAVIRRLEDPSF